MKLIVRLVFALLGALAGSQVAASPGALPFHLPSSSPWARWTIAIALGALAGLLVGSIVGGPLVRAIGRVERAAQARPAGELVVGGVGLVLGLGAAALATFAVRPLPYVGRYLLLPLALVLGYLFAVVGARSHGSILRLGGLGTEEARNEVRESRRPRLRERERPQRQTQPLAMLVDTSAIIDGRIGDLISTGFVDRELVIPVFVLQELQRVADSTDPQRRARGRRGLEVVHDLRLSSHPVATPEVSVPDITDVDAKLVRVAHEQDMPILTTDYNLNKVAQIQGVRVLNVNDLANALKPAVLPGEALRVKVIREGKEAEQGVGYLDDGTMIVVEGGRERIGELVETEVTSVLQSPSGKMIFTPAGLLTPMPGETWAVVVAAGAGDRLGADRPKAFVRLGGRTMLAWSLAMLDDHDLIDGIVMVVPEEYEERASLLADDLCATKIAAAVPGGATRPESVEAGVACVPDGAEFVLVHDAARPLTPPEVVDRVVAALRGGAEGVVPALAVADTVKRVGPDGSVAETLERGALRAVQTPQGFPTAVLREALAAHTADATDCASMVEALGRSVVCVDGDERAFKVTTPADLARAEQLAG